MLPMYRILSRTYGLARRRRSMRIFTVLLVLLVVWNEWLSFYWARLSWPSHSTSTSTNSGCVRILAVADPQLIGYRNEPELVGPFARWDADRYLRSGFSHAYSFFDPHAVIFLGDLFDEGIQATTEEFLWTNLRFESIFYVPENKDMIYIPGDNDVGGEYELVDSQLLDRFHTIFPDFIYRLKKSFTIIEVNLMSGAKIVRNITVAKEPRLRLLLSHPPYLLSYAQISPVKEPIDLILSAHDHTSHTHQRVGERLFSSPIESSQLQERIIGNGRPPFEIQFPTCSYRMGVPSMGYGAVSLCPTSRPDQFHLTYNILFLPGRYPQLIVYILYLILSVLFCVFYNIFYYYRILYSKLRVYFAPHRHYRSM